MRVMAKSGVVLPLEVGLLRICAQGLVPRMLSSDVVGVVEHLLAMQGQQVSAFPHALLVRSRGTTGRDVAAAFEQGVLVRHRPMRGTVHITHARDFHWMRMALKSEYSSWDQKHYDHLGINEHVTNQAVEVARQAIRERNGAIFRKELFTTWSTNLNTSHLDLKDMRRWCQWLMFRLAHDGQLIEGPMRANQHLFIDASVLPAADSPESGFRLTTDSKDNGRREIARRYIYGHGPVGIDDLSWWAGITKTAAADYLEKALEADTSLSRYQVEEDRLIPAKATTDVRERKRLLYMRRDLPDLLAGQRKEAQELMFLPSFDELYVGYSNRTCLTDSAGDDLICPSHNGMFRPLIISEGKLIGVRPVAQGLQWLAKPPKRLADKTERLVQDTLIRVNG